MSGFTSFIARYRPWGRVSEMPEFAKSVLLFRNSLFSVTLTTLSPNVFLMASSQRAGIRCLL